MLFWPRYHSHVPVLSRGALGAAHGDPRRQGFFTWKTAVFFDLAPRVTVRGSEGATGYERHMGVTEWSDKQDKTLKCTRRRLYSHYCSHQRRFRAF